MTGMLSLTLMFRLWGGAVLQAQSYILKPSVGISVLDKIDLGNISQYCQQTFSFTIKDIINL
jgi:hypothetical protein